MKIIHIITSLDDGGTEKILYNICKYDFNNQHIVISLKSSGKYFSKLKQIGIKVHSMKILHLQLHFRESNDNHRIHKDHYFYFCWAMFLRTIATVLDW